MEHLIPYNILFHNLVAQYNKYTKTSSNLSNVSTSEKIAKKQNRKTAWQTTLDSYRINKNLNKQTEVFKV